MSETNQRPDLTKRLKVALYSSTCSILSGVIFYPLDLVTTMVKARTRSVDLRQIISNLYKEKGVQGFYKGLDSVFWESFPSMLIYILIYDGINTKVSKILDDRNLSGFKLFIPLLSSFVSEVATLSVAVPIDTVQTRMQAHSEFVYKNMVDGFVKVYQKEGFLRLYRASASYITNSLLTTVMQFSLYEWCKMYYEAHYGTKLTLWASMASSLVATTCAVTVTNPIDNYIIRLQVTNFKKKYISSYDIFKNDILNHGVEGFTRGLGLRILSVNLHYMLIFPFYEYFRQKYSIEIN